MVEPKNNLAFPNKLILRLLEFGTDRPVPNIVVMLTLYAKLKNDYHLRPHLSNQNGEIEINRDWVKKSIDEIRDFFLMDYQSSLEECYPHINVSILSSSNITNAISAMKLYGIENSGLGIAHTVSDLIISNNNLYISHEVSIELNTVGEITREVEISLQRLTVNKK